MRVARCDFLGRLDGRVELGDGSVRMTARLTRVGVFDYDSRREAKLPEELFKKTFLDSLRGIVVVVGHPAFVEPGNWREHAIGHVGDDVRADGDFVVASVVVKDKKAIEAIDAKALEEVSLGFCCDEGPGGTFRGERYDVAQTNLLANHAGIGPRSWARVSGARLLDGGSSSIIEDAGERMARRNAEAWRR